MCAVREDERLAETIFQILGKATVVEHGIERPLDRIDVLSELHRFREECRVVDRIRTRQSKRSILAIEQFDKAVVKAKQSCTGLPVDLQLILGLNGLHRILTAYAQTRRKPEPEAVKQRLAAEYGLALCQTFGVKATSARTGKLCRVAAALFGNSDADLQYHCRKAIAKNQDKNRPAF